MTHHMPSDAVRVVLWRSEFDGPIAAEGVNDLLCPRLKWSRVNLGRVVQARNLLEDLEGKEEASRVFFTLNGCQGDVDEVQPR